MLYIYMLNLVEIFTHLSTLPFLPTLAIYTMSYSIKTFLILFEFVIKFRFCLFVCVEVLRASPPNGVMLVMSMR